MATYDDVARIALALPGTEEGVSRGWRTWRVAGRQFVWERPFTQADLRRFEAEPPTGPILGLAVDDLGEKEAVLAAHPASFFTIPHFDGYPAVLVRLDDVDEAELAEAVEDAWLVKAPRRLAAEHLARGGRTE
ncbi:MmcQ/YjbR family DNA-binding protein [Isoptericola croceus]|uniref:MmcQ/YjbR family DNA-binding protein n=1 Tax=Isoptericola croceus TaxID=3031406 RepID=UPI0023F6D810|nr:MmcQ/YjbR family DNA-binding protein [Isoptericola croceus]